MKMRKVATALFGGALIAATMITGTAAPAQAEPTSCSIGNAPDGWGYTSYCAGGTGYHVIAVIWRHPNPQMPESGVWYGEWAPVGGTSVVYIPYSREIVRVTIGKRD
ncbi:hypothetical protein [Spongiactinospora sp. TRM90649]|uniref:hypothetical protein n=1 Tax=Spongiactinospora sp. TRM90649 TaxID=3031114 RepID=UPI0023F9E544|nr:hypothetical protein [Spongiactinospora sp. TRM90649]MDF5755144.1 hypothetical protein [Spongiactinospora sp. TRM90649]